VQYKFGSVNVTTGTNSVTTEFEMYDTLNTKTGTASFVISTTANSNIVLSGSNNNISMNLEWLTF
jgi:hypothetical protein